YLLLFVTSVFSQTVNKNAIIRSGDYYYGSGVSQDATEARDQALAELTGQIAVRVASSFERKIRESADGLDEDVKTILRTHSTATLKNVQTLKKPTPAGEIEVFCYLKKSEVDRIFFERKRLIAEMARKAQEYEQAGNLAFALKLTYFATVLLNSLPDQNVVFGGVNYTTELPARINRIILNTTFSLIKDERISQKEREITLRLTHSGSPVSLLDFTFWDGSNQAAVQGRDGLATFSLLGASTKFESLKLSIKYAYYESRSEYSVVGDLWSLVNKPTFQADRTVRLYSSPKQVIKPDLTAAKNWNLSLKFEGQVPAAAKITQSTAQFLDVLAKNNTAEVNRLYQNDPFLRLKILNYLKYNHPKPLDREVTAAIRKTRSGYELRKLRVLHDYPSIHKQSTEYLVLDFSDKGELLDLNLSITAKMYQHFVEQSKFGKDWGNRQEIIKFVEKYRTAYLTRDIETVDLIFAEDALILVGRKIMRKKLPENAIQYRKLAAEPDYEYIKLSKQDYLRRQKRVFDIQKDIFLDFGSFDIVKKNNAQNVYGVEMRQSYASTTYADEGYLFLLVDFNERDPLIYVRAWQPNEWDEEALVRSGNFRVYK
ncbi:MAG: hypothetical protein ACE5IR_28650, partial [bacterium]